MGDSAQHPSQLHEPEFHSAIPPHMLDKLSDGEQAQIHAMSALEARLNWISSVLHTHHRAVNDLKEQVDEHDVALTRATAQVAGMDRQLVDVAPKVEKLVEYRNAQEAIGINAKTVALWDWKTNFTGKIALVYVIGAAIASMVLKFVGDTVMHYLGHKP